MGGMDAPRRSDGVAAGRVRLPSRPPLSDVSDDSTRPRGAAPPGTSADNPIVLGSSPVRAPGDAEPSVGSAGGRGRSYAEQPPTRTGAEQAGMSSPLSVQDLLITAVRRRQQDEDVASAAPQQSGPPDLVLPRWQPDAEVTYCPICHAQFSIFVRKHHCRYVCTPCVGQKRRSPLRQKVRASCVQLVLAAPHHDSLPIYRAAALGTAGPGAEISLYRRGRCSDQRRLQRYGWRGAS